MLSTLELPIWKGFQPAWWMNTLIHVSTPLPWNSKINIDLILLSIPFSNHIWLLDMLLIISILYMFVHVATFQLKRHSWDLNLGRSWLMNQWIMGTPWIHAGESLHCKGILSLHLCESTSMLHRSETSKIKPIKHLWTCASFSLQANACDVCLFTEPKSLTFFYHWRRYFKQVFCFGEKNAKLTREQDGESWKLRG